MREYLAQSMFDYLLKLSQGQLLLTPEQLEKVTGISAKQQSAHRTANTFPIKYKKIGKLVFYAINDVVEYLLSGQSQVEKKEEKVIKEVPVIKDGMKNSSKSVQSVSHIFAMKAFATVLEDESKELLQFSHSLNKYADSISLYEKLNEKYATKK